MGSCELPAFTRLPLGGQDAGAAEIHKAVRERVHGGGGSRGEGNCKKGANGAEMGRYTAVAAFVVKNALRLHSRIMSARNSSEMLSIPEITLSANWPRPTMQLVSVESLVRPALPGARTMNC